MFDSLNPNFSHNYSVTLCIKPVSDVSDFVSILSTFELKKHALGMF